MSGYPLLVFSCGVPFQKQNILCITHSLLGYEWLFSVETMLVYHTCCSADWCPPISYVESEYLLLLFLFLYSV